MDFVLKQNNYLILPVDKITDNIVLLRNKYKRSWFFIKCRDVNSFHENLTILHNDTANRHARRKQ